MPRPISLLCIALLLTGLPAQTSEQPIAKGSPDETACFRVESGKPGPKVLILGGVHGNEPAGFRAARQVLAWTPTRGSLLVVPRANARALAAGTRRSPGLSKARSDLNRQFPQKQGDEPKTPLARALWQLIEQERPDWILDLHEGYDFHRINKKSVGSSVIAPRDAHLREIAAGMIAAVDASIPKAEHRFKLLGPPVMGSLARAAHDRLGIPAMILETTTRSQALSKRARQHRILVHRFLLGRGMLDADADRDLLVPRGAKERHSVVAVYDSGGTGRVSGKTVEDDLLRTEGFLVRRVGPAEIRAGKLSQFEAVVFPGGSGSGQAKALGEKGRAQVRAFIRGGAGYAGFCAGAYLAAANYSWSLAILDADVIDRKHWRRGRAMLKVELTQGGKLAFAETRAGHEIRYANGPILAPAGREDLPDFDVLAHFRGEVAKNGAPKGVMPGTPAVVRGSFGKGRVFCSSPHPESTEGLEGWVVRALRWAAEGRTE